MTEKQGLKLYNALKRKVEEIETIEPGVLKFYSCGPTVYNEVHIGNLRAFVFYDLIRRTFEYFDYRVEHVMNITDVDDKTIRRSQAEGVTLKELTRRYETAFVDDLKALRIKAATAQPRATENIEGMIKLIERLKDKGLAYQSQDGSVYFSINKFEDYGQLFSIDKAELKAGAGGRVDVDEYDKESVADFALWKAYTEADGPVVWDSPFGRGRPGWHLECSVMAMERLGETMDLHAGGIDLLFPHHENEIAQAEGATGKPFAKAFVHNEHLLVGGEKMSKSKNNFYTRRQLEGEAKATGRELRYALMRTHYRRQLNFQVTEAEDGSTRFDSLEEAHKALRRVDEFVLEMRALEDGSDGGEAVSGAIRALLDASEARFRESLRDDLNVSNAVAVVFELLPKVREAGPKAADAKAVLALLESFDQVLQILPQAEDLAEDGLPADLEAMLGERLQARADKNWARADEIRDAFRERGFELKDSPQGQVWRKL